MAVINKIGFGPRSYLLASPAVLPIFRGGLIAMVGQAGDSFGYLTMSPPWHKSGESLTTEILTRSRPRHALAAPVPLLELRRCLIEFRRIRRCREQRNAISIKPMFPPSERTKTGVIDLQRMGFSSTGDQIQ